LDLDGVLADTIRPVCTLLNARYSTHFTPEQYDKWNAWEITKISKNEFLRTLDEAWFNWRSIPPVEDNIAEKVSALNGRIDIVTGRTEATVSFAKEWLHAQKIIYDKFVRVKSTAAKAELEYDVFIDDSAPLMTLIASRLFAYGVLYEQPWNRTAASMTRIYRARRWDEIPPLLKRMNTGRGLP
jgi:uncharacterized HAD superfamily protein